MSILLGTTGSYAATFKDPTKKISKAEKEAIAELEEAFEFNTELPDEKTKNYKIYDANDNLVHEVSLDTDKKAIDKKLIKYLLIADFVMEYDNTQYYRIN